MDSWINSEMETMALDTVLHECSQKFKIINLYYKNKFNFIKSDQQFIPVDELDKPFAAFVVDIYIRPNPVVQASFSI